MKIYFPVFGNRDIDRRLAAIMMRSARHYMPGVPIVQFTDADSDPCEGVDEVIRYPLVIAPPVATLHAWWYSRVSGDGIIVDNDVVFRADVRDLFRHKFEIALCERELRDPLRHTQPYIGGFILVRKPYFFVNAYHLVTCMNLADQNWYGLQLAYPKLLEGRTYQFMKLRAAEYNYTPQRSRTEEIGLPHTAKVIHFKGRRKDWMLEDKYGLMHGME